MELAVQIKASESLCVLVSISYLYTYLQVKARFRWQQGDSKVVELNEISSTLWSCQDRNWSSYRPDSAKLVKFTILPLSIHVFYAKKPTSVFLIALTDPRRRLSPSKPGKAEILGKFSIKCSHHDTNSLSLSLMASVTLLLRSLRRRETHAVSAYKFVYISPYSRGYLEILRCLGIADYQKSHLFLFLAELCKRRWEEDGAPVRRSQRYNRRCVR